MSNDEDSRVEEKKTEEDVLKQLNPDPLAPEVYETVIVKKPLRMLINKRTMEVNAISDQSPLVGRVSIGDAIVSIDRTKITDIDALNKALRGPSQVISVSFKRNSFSHSKHKCTTVEKLMVEKDKDMKVSGRAIDIYMVRIAFRLLIDEDVVKTLGLSVRYDSKERVQVVTTEMGSVAAVHLRPGDIIREVNDHPIASKTMLQFWIMTCIMKWGQARLLIESPAGGDDAYRDQVDMAPDVLEIAQKQISAFRSTIANKVPRPTAILLKKAITSKKNVRITGKGTEILIEADCDPKNLKACKNSNK